MTRYTNGRIIDYFIFTDYDFMALIIDNFILNKNYSTMSVFQYNYKNHTVCQAFNLIFCVFVLILRKLHIQWLKRLFRSFLEFVVFFGRVWFSSELPWNEHHTLSSKRNELSCLNLMICKYAILTEQGKPI